MNDMNTPSQKKPQNDTTDAIRHRQAERDQHTTPQSEEYEHEEKDLSYVDEDRLTMSKIVKYIAIGMIILLFAVLIYELVGPFRTKIALTKAGDIKSEGRKSARDEHLAKKKQQ